MAPCKVAFAMEFSSDAFVALWQWLFKVCVSWLVFLVVTGLNHSKHSDPTTVQGLKYKFLPDLIKIRKNRCHVCLQEQIAPWCFSRGFYFFMLHWAFFSLFSLCFPSVLWSVLHSDSWPGWGDAARSAVPVVCPFVCEGQTSPVVR